LAEDSFVFGVDGKKNSFSTKEKKKRKLSRKGDKRRFPIDFDEGKLKLSFAAFSI